MYICVEGVIGAGKTSLVNILENNYNCNKILEIVDENPFLKDFYENIEDLSFQTEMFFLINRFKQLEQKQDFLNQNMVVSDYSIYKNILFAKQTLNFNDYEKFNKIFNILSTELKQPDLLIFLKADLNTLKSRIEKRNRTFEKNIADDYLNKLIKSYDDYISELKSNSTVNILVLDANNLDFVNNDNDLNDVLSLINNKITSYKGVINE